MVRARRTDRALKARRPNVRVGALVYAVIERYGTTRLVTGASAALVLAALVSGMAAHAISANHDGVLATLAVLLIIMVPTLVAIPLLLAAAGLLAHLVDVRRQLLGEIGRRQQAEDLLKKQAATDELTGLYNRRQFVARSQDALARLRRYRTPFSVMLLDIDHFKRINDTQGHSAGDAALIKVAEIVKATLRETDCAARFGGDELVVLMPETGERAASVAASRLRQRIEEECRDIGLTVSIGLACTGSDVELSLEEMLARSDDALYAAKESGRNWVSITRSDGTRDDVSLSDH